MVDVILYGYFVGADRAHEVLLVQYAEARRRRESLPFHFFLKKKQTRVPFFFQAFGAYVRPQEKGAAQRSKKGKRNLGDPQKKGVIPGHIGKGAKTK